MTNRFKIGSEVILIKMGKDNFKADVVPCVIVKYISGNGDLLCEVILQNKQQIQIWEDCLYYKEEAKEYLSEWFDRKIDYFK